MEQTLPESRRNYLIMPQQLFEKEGHKIVRSCFTVAYYTDGQLREEFEHTRIGEAKDTFRTFKNLLKEGKDLPQKK